MELLTYSSISLIRLCLSREDNAWARKLAQGQWIEKMLYSCVTKLFVLEMWLMWLSDYLGTSGCKQGRIGNNTWEGGMGKPSGVHYSDPSQQFPVHTPCTRYISQTTTNFPHGPADPWILTSGDRVSIRSNGNGHYVGTKPRGFDPRPCCRQRQEQD